MIVTDEMVERAARKRYARNLRAIIDACETAIMDHPNSHMVPQWRENAESARAQTWENEPAHLTQQLRDEIREIVNDAVNG